jgi:hypothetical protein
MAKKIIETGKPARRIEVSGKPQRRIEPEAFAAALGAEPIGEAHTPNLDPLSLATLGNELIKRLRSSGGRPALADATEICRVPLSVEDLESLEKITEQIAQATGTKPSPGQVASVLVHQSLNIASEKAGNCVVPPSPKPEWPSDWNGNREKYRAAQEVIQGAKSTWGKAA